MSISVEGPRCTGSLKCTERCSGKAVAYVQTWVQVYHGGPGNSEIIMNQGVLVGKRV